MAAGALPVGVSEAVDVAVTVPAEMPPPVEEMVALTKVVLRDMEIMVPELLAA